MSFIVLKNICRLSLETEFFLLLNFPIQYKIYNKISQQRLFIQILQIYSNICNSQQSQNFHQLNMKRKVQKIPLFYSMAQEVLVQELDDNSQQKNSSKFYTNKCAMDFLAYIQSIENGIDSNKAKVVNQQIHSYYSTQKQKTRGDQYMRNMLQALSFNLSPDQAGQIFRKAMDAQVPNKGQNENQKKKGRQVYQQMYKLLNNQQ